MAGRGAALANLFSQGPDVLEQVFAQDVGRNPLAPAYLFGATANRQARDVAGQQAYLEAAGAESESARQLKQMEIAGNILNTIAGKDAGLPSVMEAEGLDPKNALASLMAGIGKVRGETYQAAAGGAKSAAEAGLSQEPDIMTELGFPTPSVGEPLNMAIQRMKDATDIQTANIAASAKRATEGTGGGVEVSDTWYDAGTKTNRTVKRKAGPNDPAVLRVTGSPDIQRMNQFPNVDRSKTSSIAIQYGDPARNAIEQLHPGTTVDGEVVAEPQLDGDTVIWVPSQNTSGTHPGYTGFRLSELKQRLGQ